MRIKTLRIWINPIYLALYGISIVVLWRAFGVPLWAAVLLVVLPTIRLKLTKEQ